VSCPNVNHLAIRVRLLGGQADLQGLEDYRKSGVHRTSHRMLRNWLGSSGFRIAELRDVIAVRWQNYDRLTMGFAKELWAEEFIAVGRKQAEQNHHHREARVKQKESRSEITDKNGRSKIPSRA
jgi:hypothetical protein